MLLSFCLLAGLLRVLALLESWKGKGQEEGECLPVSIVSQYFKRNTFTNLQLRAA